MALRAVVIGAGLAGTAVARALGQRGVFVTLLDSGPSVASGASGNPAGIILPHLAIEKNPTFHFSNLGREFLLGLLSQSVAEESAVRHALCGVLSLARDAQELRRMERALHAGGCPPQTQRVSQEQASHIAGLNVQGEGVFFSRAGWVDPQSLCSFNLRAMQPYLQLLLHTPVDRICQESSSENSDWLAINDSKGVVARGDVLIVANGFDCKKFVQTQAIPLFKVRGQVESLEPSDVSKNLKTVISYGGYVTPFLGGESQCHMAGATFDWKDLSPNPRDLERQMILNDLAQVTSGFGKPPASRGSRVAFRATSPDTLPMVGQVCDPASVKGQLSYFDGLYVSVGHGSRGLLYTQISGEILAAQICGEPTPVDESLVSHLSPARFLRRAWRKVT